MIFLSFISFLIFNIFNVIAEDIYSDVSCAPFIPTSYSETLGFNIGLFEAPFKGNLNIIYDKLTSDTELYLSFPYPPVSRIYDLSLNITVDDSNGPVLSDVFEDFAYDEITITNFSMVALGIFVPPETGDYTFSIDDVSDGAAIFIFADRNMYCCNTMDFMNWLSSTEKVFNIPTDPAHTTPPKTIHMVKGLSYMLMYSYINLSGDAVFKPTVTFPSGEKLSDLEGYIKGQYKGFECGVGESTSTLVSQGDQSFTTTYSTSVLTNYGTGSILGLPFTEYETIYYVLTPAAVSSSLTSSTVITSSSELQISSSTESDNDEIVSSSNMNSGLMSSESQIVSSGVSSTLSSSELTSIMSSVTSSTIVPSDVSSDTSPSSSSSASSSVLGGSSLVDSSSDSAPFVSTRSTSEVSILPSSLSLVYSTIEINSYPSSSVLPDSSVTSSADISNVSSDLVSSNIYTKTISSINTVNSFSNSSTFVTSTLEMEFSSIKVSDRYPSLTDKISETTTIGSLSYSAAKTVSQTISIDSVYMSPLVSFSVSTFSVESDISRTVVPEQSMEYLSDEAVNIKTSVLSGNIPPTMKTDGGKKSNGYSISYFPAEFTSRPMDETVSMTNDVLTEHSNNNNHNTMYIEDNTSYQTDSFHIVTSISSSSMEIYENHNQASFIKPTMISSVILFMLSVFIM
ncbi:hypothetical protein C6P45_002821 [Maudiozyma exigua]|uniref:PA14 domain-containing protein n=1 Tax=Maudiozyma exigua TaxID=34358 RepID=A0A9P6VWP8_MAUEX|nr:hypothetical protein C6P45_002821 [Kazachstania exigua]